MDMHGSEFMRIPIRVVGGTARTLHQAAQVCFEMALMGDLLVWLFIGACRPVVQFIFEDFNELRIYIGLQFVQGGLR